MNAFSGTPGGTRTPDNQIRNLGLFQLSYGRIAHHLTDQPSSSQEHSGVESRVFRGGFLPVVEGIVWQTRCHRRFELTRGLRTQPFLHSPRRLSFTYCQLSSCRGPRFFANDRRARPAGGGAGSNTGSHDDRAPHALARVRRFFRNQPARCVQTADLFNPEWFRGRAIFLKGGAA